MIDAPTTRARALPERPAELLGVALAAMLMGSGCGAPSARPSSGGATDDFGGSMRGCTGEREVPLDQQIESLGYSSREAVEAFGDSQTFRLVWVPNCSSDSCELRENPDDRERCQLDESQLPPFAGTQSEITVTVRPTHAFAVAQVPGPGESVDTCVSAVNVAVDVTFESDDGVVDGTAQGDLGGGVEYVQLNVNVNAAHLGGKLADELPEGSAVEMIMEAVPGDFHGHVSIFAPAREDGRNRLLLEGLMLPAMECTSPFQGTVQG